MQKEVDLSSTLQHERLDACKVAVELDSAVVTIAHRAGRGDAWLADQAMRASASVVLNLAEALGGKGPTAPGRCGSPGAQPWSWTRPWPSCCIAAPAGRRSGRRRRGSRCGWWRCSRPCGTALHPEGRGPGIGLGFGLGHGSGPRPWGAVG